MEQHSKKISHYSSRVKFWNLQESTKYEYKIVTLLKVFNHIFVRFGFRRFSTDCYDLDGFYWCDQILPTPLYAHKCFFFFALSIIITRKQWLLCLYYTASVQQTQTNKYLKRDLSQSIYVFSPKPKRRRRGITEIFLRH